MPSNGAWHSLVTGKRSTAVKHLLVWRKSRGWSISASLHFNCCKGNVKRQLGETELFRFGLPKYFPNPWNSRTAACVFPHPVKAPTVRFYSAFLNTMANKLQNRQLLWKSLLYVLHYLHNIYDSSAAKGGILRGLQFLQASDRLSQP